MAPALKVANLANSLVAWMPPRGSLWGLAPTGLALTLFPWCHTWPWLPPFPTQAFPASAPRPYRFFGPGTRCRRRRVVPPLFNIWVVRRFFRFSIEAREAAYPPLIWADPKILYAKYGQVVTPSGAIEAFIRHPYPFPLDVHFVGHGGSVSGPPYRRFIFSEKWLRMNLGSQYYQAGEVGQEKGLAPCADFLMPAATAPAPLGPAPLALIWSETGNLGTVLSPSQCDLESPLQGFRDANHMERLAEGRIVASNADLHPRWTGWSIV